MWKSIKCWGVSYLLCYHSWCHINSFLLSRCSWWKGLQRTENGNGQQLSSLGEEFSFSNSLLIREAWGVGGGPQREGIQFCFSHMLLYNNATPCFFQCPGEMDFVIALSMCSAPLAFWGKLQQWDPVLDQCLGFLGNFFRLQTAGGRVGSGAWCGLAFYYIMTRIFLH